MTSALGFENKSVILFWKAFEEKRFLACSLHLKSQGFQKPCEKCLTSQKKSNIIDLEREVLKMVRTEKENKKLKWLKNDDYATICRKYEKKLAEYKNKKGQV